MLVNVKFKIETLSNFLSNIILDQSYNLSRLQFIYQSNYLYLISEVNCRVKLHLNLWSKIYARNKVQKHSLNDKASVFYSLNVPMVW